MKRIMVSLIVISLATLMGCSHTVQGFGKDMQHNGQSIEHKAS